MTGPSWYERAEDELCEALNNGEISRSEFDSEMRELNWQLRSEAEEAAQSAYDNAVGGW